MPNLFFPPAATTEPYLPQQSADSGLIHYFYRVNSNRHPALPGSILFWVYLIVSSCQSAHAQIGFEEQLNYHPVVQNGYYVLSNSTVQQTALTHYDTILPVRCREYGYFVFGSPCISDTLWKARLRNGRCDLYSITGTKINTKPFDSLQVDSNGNVHIWSGGNQGLVTSDLRYIEPHYDQLTIVVLEGLKGDIVQSNEAVIIRTGTSYGFYAADGTLLKPRFSSIEPDPRNSGLFIAGKFGKEGFIHPVTGSVGVPRKGILEMDTIRRKDVYEHPSTTWLIVHVKDSAYEMNLYGEMRPLKNYTVHIRLDLKKTQRFGLYAKSEEDPSAGYWLTAPKFSLIKKVGGGYYEVRRGSKRRGLYNDRGKEIIPVSMRKIYWKPAFRYGWNDRNYFTVLKNGKLGVYVDVPGKGGNLLVPIEQDYIGRMVKGHQFAIRVRKNGKWGLYSFDGKVLFTTTYDYTDVSTIYKDTLPYGICMAYAEGQLFTKTYSSLYTTKITDISERIPIAVFIDHYNRFCIFKSDGLWYLHHYDSLFTREFDRKRYDIAGQYYVSKHGFLRRHYTYYDSVPGPEVKKYRTIYMHYLLKEDNKFVLVQGPDSTARPMAQGVFSMNISCNRYWIYAYKHYHKTKRKKPLPRMRQVRRMRPWQQRHRKCRRR